MNIIIPLGGIGKRFKDAGYDEPKPLIPLCSKTIIEHVLDSISRQSNDTIFVVYHTSLDAYFFHDRMQKKYPMVHFISMHKRTKGAAETVLFGIDYILTNQRSHLSRCLLLDGDTIYHTDITKTFRTLDTNAVLYFEDHGTNPIYSYIALEGDRITDIIEKERISSFANTGAYFFKDIMELQESCQYVIQHNCTFKDEYYTSCVIKTMLQRDMSFVGIPILSHQYSSVGTPEELDRYKEQHRAFLFDLDGTLVCTDHIYFKIWKEILQIFHITLTEYVFQHFIQGNSDSYAMDRLQIDKTKYTIEYISQLKDELFIKYIDDIRIINGAFDFMERIKEYGYAICIVTNCNRMTAEIILKHVHIESFVDHLIIGNECNRPKPYPDPYQKAIQLLQTTNNKCIIFEDSKPGLLSALHVSPKNIIGVDNGTNRHILEELSIKNIINSYVDVDIHTIMENKTDSRQIIHDMIYTSLQNRYDISRIDIDMNKLKGGYISDVIKVLITLQSGEEIDAVLKYENDYTSSLTQMARTLGLYDREYYFYEAISPYINIHVPKYIGTIKNSQFISKGILLTNINKDNFTLGLDLNKESIDVSLKVMEQCARFHSHFWKKDLSRSFKDLKKHNDALFFPSWGTFVKEKWELFYQTWQHLIPTSLSVKLQRIIHNFENVQTNLSKGSLTLCHGDVKSGNIFYKHTTDGGYIPYFIDWQYISHGKGVQDIVFFMIESFTIENIKEYSSLCKQYYYIKLKEYGVSDYSIEEYNQDFIDALCYFPIFVGIWFGTTPVDELIDTSFPFLFIQKLFYFIELYI